MRRVGCSFGTRLETGDECQESPMCLQGQYACREGGPGRRGAGQTPRLGGGVIGMAVTPAGTVTP